MAAGKAIVVGVKTRKARARRYGTEVFTALKKIWFIMGCICGKRLVAALGEVVPILLKHKELVIGEETRGKLLRMSAATIDRQLTQERKKQTIKGKSNTKPGTLLKSRIPIRTFWQWDENMPGFVEIDLVGHDGGDGAGEYAQTLDATDICTGWTETQAVRNKAEKWVFEAIKDITRECLTNCVNA